MNNVNHDRGQVIGLQHESDLLRGNVWGDPCERQLSVYLPPGHGQSDHRLPVIWQLAAYTNSGLSMGNWRNFGESLPQRLDRLIASGDMEPAIVVAPDCFTRLGGNQYLDSDQTGQYLSYVHDELVPFVESKLPVLAGPAHRAVLGKSSGGYGALQFALRRSGFWRGVAVHAGDCHFDVSVRNDFPAVAAELARHEFDTDAFIAEIENSRSPRGSQIHALMFLCLAATYDPGQGTRINLPFDTRTLVMNDERWQNWIRNDPIWQVDHGAAQALKALDYLWIDVGNRDQYHLQYGARLLSQRLREHDVAHTFEEFDGTHSGIDWRLDHSLPALSQLISKR